MRFVSFREKRKESKRKRLKHLPTSVVKHTSRSTSSARRRRRGGLDQGRGAMLLFFFSLSLSSLLLSLSLSLSLSSEPLVSKHEKSHHLRLIDYYAISTQSSKSRRSDFLIFQFVRSSVQKKEKKKRGGRGGKGKSRSFKGTFGGVHDSDEVRWIVLIVYYRCLFIFSLLLLGFLQQLVVILIQRSGVFLQAFVLCFHFLHLLL